MIQGGLWRNQDLELLFARRLLLDNLHDSSGIVRFFELKHKVLGFDGISFIVESDGSRNSFEVF